MSEFKIGDRVRYVPRETDALEYGTVAEDVWQRRTERDSLVVGVPDDDEYPTQYRLVSIFEPDEEASWSDRDFWFAPAKRLRAVDNPTTKAAARKAWNEGFDRGWYAALERTGETIPNPYGQADVL